ncbi:MAG: LuxR family transcriptional regulator [Pseudomonadota bacterium]
MDGSVWEANDGRLAGCETVSTLAATLERYAGEVGLPYYSYLIMRNEDGAETADEGCLITNYPDEWTKRYTRKLYRHYDPVALTTRRSRMPFFWDRGAFLRGFRKEQRSVFYEARAFEIGAGYSIPIAGPRGDIGVFSLVGARSGDVDDAIGEAGGSIYLKAVQVHDRMLDLTGARREPDTDHALSPREIECLRWTADGKTSDQIAEIVSISAATVNYHLKNAIAKLDAANRHHAAIKAIRMGMIG